MTGITNNAAGIVNHSGSSTITSFNNATATSTLNISTTPTVPTITTLTVSAAGNTVNYSGAGAQTVIVVAYSNLILSGSGAKSIATGTSVAGNLSIAPSGSATASIGTGLNISVGTLTLGGTGTVNGTWGSTSSSATNQNNTYFAATNGIVTVATSTSPSIALSDNGTQITAANIVVGTTNVVLSTSMLTITTANATLTGMTCTTAGTYTSAGLTNLKVWYQTTSTFTGGGTVLSTYTTPGTAEQKHFLRFYHRQ